jgi:hypothetical protein
MRMRVKARPQIREQILVLGMRPLVEHGEWNGYTMFDDGTGRLHAWMDRTGGTGVPVDGIRRVALAGSMEKEARRMAIEGVWGEEARIAELERKRRVRRRRT